eukprot:gene7472-10185_t
MSSLRSFFSLQHFAVVGASLDRSKFGNKVLRSYIQNRLPVTPINKRQEIIEGIECFGSLDALTKYVSSKGINSHHIGVSIITPPGVSKTVIEEGIKLGIKQYFLQPGTVDEDLLNFMNDWKNIDPSLNFIQGCVLVELGFNDASES